MGSAQVVAWIKPAKVPGVPARERPERGWLRSHPSTGYEDFDAWVVDYMRHRVHKRGFVVWDSATLQFYWLLEPKPRKRQSSPLENP